MGYDFAEEEKSLLHCIGLYSPPNIARMTYEIHEECVTNREKESYISLLF
jgi:hypothetical protein